MNEQQYFWAKEYAKEYIEKNTKFDQNMGVDGWAKMLAKSNSIETVLECGCNIGRNIKFLNDVLPEAKKSIIEISETAFNFVKEEYQLQHLYNGSILDSNIKSKFDLVFTMGVLIHIHPDDLLKNIDKMMSYSNKYILVGEYFNRTPVELEYQGQSNKLFKRDYGSLIMDNYPVELVDYGFLWGRLYDRAGFDDVTWWLLERK